MAEDADKIYEGILAIHKPFGISSAQVLDDVKKHFTKSKVFAPWLEAEKKRTQQQHWNNRRKKFKNRSQQVKLGHGGTLDPRASGVLIVGVGKGTKSLSQFLACTKSYDTTVLFGAATDTYDAEGKIIGVANTTHITKQKVVEALEQFKGSIMQKPPIYSALSVKGKRMYEYAREGGEIPEVQPRPARVLSMEVTDYFEPGEHHYAFPEQQAPKEEQEIAKKLLPGAAGAPEIPTNEDKSSTKRPQDDSETSLDIDEREPKKARLDSAATITEASVESDNPGPESPADRKIQGQADAIPNQIDTTKLPGKHYQSGSSSAAESKTLPLPAAPAVNITMTVGSGFYVRSLAYDLGLAVGSLAFMAGLVRTRQGDFELGKNVLEFTDLEKGEETWGPKVKVMLSQRSENQERAQQEDEKREEEQ